MPLFWLIVRRSEILPVNLEFNCRNFNFVLRNVFLTRFWPRLPTFRFVLRQNFYFSKKHQRLTLCTFFGEIFQIRVGHNFEHLKGYLWQCTRYQWETLLFWFTEHENPKISLDIWSTTVAISISIRKTYFSQDFLPVCPPIDSFCDKFFFPRKNTKG